MSDTKDLISLLTPLERKAFTKYLSDRNKRHDTRNTQLFKAFTQGKEMKIKLEIGANAYNVLKKRLTDRLLDFISRNTLKNEVSEEVSIIKQILLGRKLFMYGKIKLGYKILHKAEEDASRINHYALLNEIYHTLIEYSHHGESQNQEELFQKLKTNNSDYLEQEKLNMVYAIVRKAYRAAEYESDPVHLEGILMTNFAKFNIKDNFGYSFQSLHQLASIANISGAQSKNYHDVALFFEYRIRKLQGGAGDVEKMLGYQIKLLYTVAHIYFRKKQFNKSMDYLSQMHGQMERYNKKYYNEYFVRYTTMRALNLNFRGDHSAAAGELDVLFTMRIFKEDSLLNAKLSRAMIHFQQGELQQANAILSKFQRTDSWYERHLGLNWILNKNFMEILLHIDLGHVDFVDSRMNSFLRKYRSHFKDSKDSKELNFIKLIRKYYEDPSYVDSDEFREVVESSIEYKPKDQEDLILMSFYAWLKSKMENKELYNTTLDLVTG